MRLHHRYAGIPAVPRNHREGEALETIEYRTVDKTSWGEGPWQEEPDKKQWLDPATGLPCLIVRNDGGALCGYVGVFSDHPDFGRHYDTIDVEVHCGLTFGDFCAESADESRYICHKSSDAREVWWLGFDCSHCYDVRPADNAVLRRYSFGDGAGIATYRDWGYVVCGVLDLARQLSQRNE